MIHNIIFNVRNVPEITIEFNNEVNGVSKYSAKYNEILLSEEVIKSPQAGSYIRRTIDMNEICFLNNLKLNAPKFTCCTVTLINCYQKL